MALSDSNITNLLLNIEYSDKSSLLVEQYTLITDELDLAWHQYDKYQWLCEDNEDAEEHDAYVLVLQNTRKLIAMRIRRLGREVPSRAYGA